MNLMKTSEPVNSELVQKPSTLIYDVIKIGGVYPLEPWDLMARVVVCAVVVLCAHGQSSH